MEKAPFETILKILTAYPDINLDDQQLVQGLLDNKDPS
jgi:hypothetical protein